MAVLQPYFSPLVPGDFNGDGTVDAADYVTWRKGLSGLYAGADYAWWQADFGRNSFAARAAVVPESGAALLRRAILARDRPRMVRHMD